MSARSAFAPLLACAAALLLGCASTAAPPSRAPDIRGTITQVSRSEERTSVLIEEQPGTTSGSDKSWVTIPAGASLLRREAAGYRPFPAGELAAGMRASAWFEGPVAESYPTQATAGTLLVESD